MTESALVSCEWLKQNLNAEKQIILDATFFLPRQQRNAQIEYQQHIPGALFFDIDQVADLNNPLPHTLPNSQQFADAVGNLGIDNNTLVIISLQLPEPGGCFESLGITRCEFWMGD